MLLGRGTSVILCLTCCLWHNGNKQFSSTHFVVQVSGQLSTDHRVDGLIPSSLCPHVEVSLVKRLIPLSVSMCDCMNVKGKQKI